MVVTFPGGTYFNSQAQDTNIPGASNPFATSLSGTPGAGTDATSVGASTSFQDPNSFYGGMFGNPYGGYSPYGGFGYGSPFGGFGGMYGNPYGGFGMPFGFGGEGGGFNFNDFFTQFFQNMSQYLQPQQAAQEPIYANDPYRDEPLGYDDWVDINNSDSATGMPLEDDYIRYEGPINPTYYDPETGTRSHNPPGGSSPVGTGGGGGFTSPSVYSPKKFTQKDKFGSRFINKGKFSKKVKRKMKKAGYDMSQFKGKSKSERKELINNVRSGSYSPGSSGTGRLPSNFKFSSSGRSSSGSSRSNSSSRTTSRYTPIRKTSRSSTSSRPTRVSSFRISKK